MGKLKDELEQQAERSYARVTLTMAAFKWIVLLLALALAYLYNAWAAFGITMCLIYAADLSRRIARRYAIDEHIKAQRKTFDKTTDETFPKAKAAKPA